MTASQDFEPKDGACLAFFYPRADSSVLSKHSNGACWTNDHCLGLPGSRWSEGGQARTSLLKMRPGPHFTPSHLNTKAVTPFALCP